jgi:coenzyme F420-reducing hydrogenase beta subunit
MELCPRCKALRNVCADVSRRKVALPDGTTKEVLTRTFHCESCHAFIRSEELDQNAGSET